MRGLRVLIGGRHILHGVDLDMAGGGVTALLGRNGAGKTTTVRGVLGLVPRTGSVLLDGAETVGLPTHTLVRRGIGYAPEDRGVFTGLTVAENLPAAVADLPAVLRVPLSQPLFLLGMLFVVVVGVLPGGLAALPGRVRAARAARRGAEAGSGYADGGHGEESAADGPKSGSGTGGPRTAPTVPHSRATAAGADADVKERQSS
ncbi:ATP-binding cassette domain-containing protein [Streptomyces sp. NPDC102462]|uniref:ATP-binding cassette domain-containing protein n=1 Tax=Streptomyces sp. NPDC102462 TaxID=3366178 RepID=UPI0037F4AC7C